MNYTSAFATVADRYPAGARSGPWEVRRFSVTPEEERFGRLRAAINPQRAYRYVPSGTYVGLFHERRGVVMSATPDEMRDHAAPFRMAERASKPVRVLVNGMGLGMVVSGLLTLPHVARVDVCEIDPDVVSLAATAFSSEIADGRVVVTQGDARAVAWPRGVTWDVAWHDIWDNICADNRADMIRLRRRFGRRARWQGCWSEKLLR